MGCNYKGFCSLWKNLKCMVLVLCLYQESWWISQDMYCWSFLQMRLLGHKGCIWSRFRSCQRRVWGNKPGFCTCCLLMGWIVQWSPLEPWNPFLIPSYESPPQLSCWTEQRSGRETSFLSCRPSLWPSWLFPDDLLLIQSEEPEKADSTLSWTHLPPMAPKVLRPSQICQRDWHRLGWQGPSMLYGTKDGGESPHCLSRLLQQRQEMKWAWTYAVWKSLGVLRSPRCQGKNYSLLRSPTL